MKLHVFGDSHVAALHAGAQPLRPQFEQAGLDVDFYCRQGPNWRTVRTRINGNAIRFKTACPWEKPLDYTVDALADIYIFCAPLHTAEVWREPAWRDFCSWRSAKDFPDLHPVSDSMIEPLIEGQVARPLQILREMKEQGYMVLVAEPPKPLQQGPRACGFEPGVVVGIDHMFRQNVLRRLVEIGIPVIYVPESTHENGLTPNRYSDPRPNDTHHGNAAFGTAMMKQIVQTTTGITLN